MNPKLLDADCLSGTVQRVFAVPDPADHVGGGVSLHERENLYLDVRGYFILLAYFTCQPLAALHYNCRMQIVDQRGGLELFEDDYFVDKTEGLQHGLAIFL